MAAADVAGAAAAGELVLAEFQSMVRLERMMTARCREAARMPKLGCIDASSRL